MRRPLVSYSLYSYSMGEGVKGILPDSEPNRKNVTLYVESQYKRPEDGRTQFVYSVSDPSFVAPESNDNQNTAIGALESQLEQAGWKIAHEGKRVFR